MVIGYREILYIALYWLTYTCDYNIQAGTLQNAVSRATHSSTTIAAPVDTGSIILSAAVGHPGEIRGTDPPPALGTAP